MGVEKFAAEKELPPAAQMNSAPVMVPRFHTDKQHGFVPNETVKATSLRLGKIDYVVASAALRLRL
jgi:hypothetical protein